MGVVAHDYQIQKKGVQPNADILVSPVCIYSDYTFSQHYIPRHHIPNIIVPATYSWILWESHSEVSMDTSETNTESN